MDTVQLYPGLFYWVIPTNLGKHLRLSSMLAALSIACAGMVAPTVDVRHAPLLNWLESCGATLGPVTLGKSRCGAGYGAFASRAVEEGEMLFSVPSSACVTLYDACGDEEVGKSFAQLVDKGQGGATVALAGIVAKQWLCEGTEGPKGPYLAMLPWDAAWPPEGDQEQECADLRLAMPTTATLLLLHVAATEAWISSHLVGSRPIWSHCPASPPPGALFLV